jgi:hypothetical protein
VRRVRSRRLRLGLASGHLWGRLGGSTEPQAGTTVGFAAGFRKKKKMLSGFIIATLAASTFVLLFWRVNSSRTSCSQAEREMLCGVRCAFRLERVSVGGGNFINTLIIGGAPQPPAVGRKPSLVLLHGWGGGYAIFKHSFDVLAEHFEVCAVQNIGTDCSGLCAAHGLVRALAYIEPISRRSTLLIC